MENRRWAQKIPALLFLLAASYVFLRSYVYRAPRHVDLSALRLHDLQGAPIPVDTLRGRPVVLNFWAPWCSPCRTEMPWLAELQRKHPEATVVGLEDDSDALEQALSLQETQQVPYLLAAPNTLTRKAFGNVAGLPTTLYISRSGKVIHTISGVVPEGIMEKYLDDTDRSD